jgi:flavin-dependent thymidylate synthase
VKVSLIDYTGNGTDNPARAAANTLAFTKATRLNMTPGLLAEIEAWPDKRMMDELTYMANTIPSSWEFCHYTFLIQDVSRAFTHQLVRTRTASFAQQTMRVLDVNGWDYAVGPTISNDTERTTIYADAMGQIDDTYRLLIDKGAKVEDARGILPTNIHTNIIMGVNMRTLCEMLRKRSSSRTQGEYRDVMEEVKAAVLWVHPWAELFLNRTFDVAAKELENTLLCLTERTLGAVSKEETVAMIKLIDQMRMNA